ncbi:TonB-dependent receptor [Rudaea sp.]|uniref:TonB-dependent receptor n=1 Tax=Rudaea sp. TaxID=2136325 RepID=UPI002ED4E04A
MLSPRLARATRAPRRYTLSLAIACALAGNAAFAADAAPAADEAAAPKQLADITVTAEKRSENLQKVPVSVTAIDPEKLDVLKSGSDDVRFLSARVPSLLIESSFGRTFPRFYIRGLGNTDFDLNASQPVSFVYDDVVLENPILKGFPVFDIDQVEVLRGPQGTLFGRNTPAGVVKLQSKRPTQEPDGYVDVSYGRYGTTNVETAFGAGINQDWAFRVSFLDQHRDDWVKNTAPGKSNELGGYNTQALRLQFEYKPSDTFDALLNIHGMNINGSAILFRANIIQAGTNDFVPGWKRDEISIDGNNFQNVTSSGASLHLTWGFENMELASITSFDRVKTLSHGDIDGGYGAVYAPGGVMGPGFIPFASESADGLPFHRQITQEVRLSSKNTSPLDWIVGAYYFNENITVDSFNYETIFCDHCADGYAQQKQKDVSEALFGSLGYQVNDAFKIKGGLRVSHDEKNWTATRYSAPTSTGAGPLGPLFLDPSTTRTTGDLSATYSLDKDTTLYARAATGYRAPSIQGRLLFGDTPSVGKTETITSGEFGIKSDLFDHRATINADVYAYEIKNQQLTAVGGGTNFAKLVNAKKTEGRGFEVDARAYVTDNLMVTAGGSYNYTKIKDPNLYIAPCGSSPFGGPFCHVLDPTITEGGVVLASIDGNPLPQAPKWIGNITARYAIPFKDGELFAYTDWAYRSKVDYFLYRAVEFTGKAWVEGGLRVGYAWHDNKREVSFYGRNILDKKAITGGIDFDNLTGYVNEPRIWGVQFRGEL